MVDLPTVGRFVGGAGYAPLTETSLRALVSGVPACSDLLKGDAVDWKIREVGDGNLNLVFIVTSGTAGVVVKQALPYVRLVGKSWPLPLDRAHFEHEALKVQAAYVPMHVPKVYHFDPEQAAIVMAYLSPHIILAQRLNPADEVSPAGRSPVDLPRRNAVPHIRSWHARRCQEGGASPVMPEHRLMQNQRRPHLHGPL
jgi:hypothetical protein